MHSPLHQQIEWQRAAWACFFLIDPTEREREKSVHHKTRNVTWRNDAACWCGEKKIFCGDSIAKYLCQTFWLTKYTQVGLVSNKCSSDWGGEWTGWMEDLALSVALCVSPQVMSLVKMSFVCVCAFCNTSSCQSNKKKCSQLLSGMVLSHPSHHSLGGEGSDNLLVLIWKSKNKSVKKKLISRCVVDEGQTVCWAKVVLVTISAAPCCTFQLDFFLVFQAAAAAHKPLTFDNRFCPEVKVEVIPARHASTWLIVSERRSYTPETITQCDHNGRH